jgi:predicted dehydrogenase
VTELPIAIVGTSWWADAMYLPALEASPMAAVVAVCGRDSKRTNQFAERWSVPHTFTSYQEMLQSGLCRAVIIATPNDTHHQIAMASIERGLHVLCEKPLGLDYRQASEMVEAAAQAGVTTLVPFTYRYMPTTRFVKQLLDEGYLGDPYHLNLRYYTAYGRSGGYLWRMDMRRAGSGVLGDIGSHFLHLADWFFGEIEEVSCRLGRMVERPATDPEGNSYQQGDDTAMVMLRFGNGAQGVVHASAVAYEENLFGQVHEMDLHGSGGTLRQVIDWDRVQMVQGARVGKGPVRELTVPESIWKGARRDHVKDTYHDVFRKQGFMVGEFVEAAASGRQVRPDFADGARLQSVLDAALRSHQEGRNVQVDEVTSG